MNGKPCPLGKEQVRGREVDRRNQNERYSEFEIIPSQYIENTEREYKESKDPIHCAVNCRLVHDD